MITYRDVSPQFTRSPRVCRDRRTIYADANLRAAVIGIREEISDLIQMFQASNNPVTYYGHTCDGIVLACQYGSPCDLLTPWGQFNIHHGGTNKEPNWLEKLQHLKLSEVTPEFYIENAMYGGQKGPLYTIGHYNGPLPAACFALTANAITGWHGKLCFDSELESLRGRSLKEFSETFDVPERYLVDAVDEISGHISIRTIRSLIVKHYWKSTEVI